MKFRSHQNGIGKVFFTSDTHFGHAAVIHMCNREYADVDAMDHALIAAWNAVVGPRDVIWHLGDFAYGCEPERMRKIFQKLRGQKHLIIGNHDRKHVLDLPWTTKQQMAHVTVDGQRVHLCHYGLRVWPGQWKGAIHLYGHSHGRLPGNRKTMDVGVDAVGPLPLDIEQITAKLDKLPEVPIQDDIEAIEGQEDDTSDFTV